MQRITSSAFSTTVSNTLHLIDPREQHVWEIAKKTKPVLAAPIEMLLNQVHPALKFLLETLEGTQALKPGSIVCIGANNDAWQQDQKVLLKKYNLVGFENGLMRFEPKPEAETQVFLVTPEMADSNGDFAVMGLWGKTVEGRENIQFGKVGDYIGHNGNPNDYWVIAKHVFDNTYELQTANRVTASAENTTAVVSQ